MLSEDFLSKFLLTLMDIRIELVTVFTNGELLVVIDWNLDFLGTDWFLVWIMELSNIWVLQSLIGCESLGWVEHK